MGAQRERGECLLGKWILRAADQQCVAHKGTPDELQALLVVELGGLLRERSELEHMVHAGVAGDSARERDFGVRAGHDTVQRRRHIAEHRLSH